MASDEASGLFSELLLGLDEGYGHLASIEIVVYIRDVSGGEHFCWCFFCVDIEVIICTC